MNKPIGSQGHPASCYPTEKRKPTISSYLSIVRLVNRKSIAVESYSPHPSGTGVAPSVDRKVSDSRSRGWLEWRVLQPLHNV